jgi:3-hydroxyisobutyrate dehydrogenase-like beta-hydroxyacid dehydrogenase
VTDTIGVVGLGNMGAAVAGRLALEFDVYGYDPSAERRTVAATLGVTPVDEVAGLASRTSTIVLSLPRPEISASSIRCLLDAGLGSGAVVIETSTIRPSDARSDAAVCADWGAEYVDAAILSGVKSVAEGATLLLVGGAESAVERSKDALNAITTNRRWLGAVGAGMAAKVINNAVAHDVYVVLSEAVALGRANGIGIDVLADVLGDPEGGLVRPLTHRIIERLAERNFDGGMPIEAARKDSQLALDLGQASGVPLFATQAAHTVYEIALARGLGRLDYSAIATLWENWGDNAKC